MDNKDFIRKLNWFYSLELNQVSLYTTQAKNVDDIYLKRALQRVAVIEQRHVDNIADKFKQYGKEPTLIGELIAPITGDIAGMITGKSGIIRLLKADIALEQKAMADYKDFILKAGKDQDLFDLLWDHLIDEDLHTAWFSNKVRELEQLKN